MPGVITMGLEILVGLILLWGVSELLFLDLFGLGRYRTRKKFPAVAERMGLTAESRWSWHVFPEYKGIYNGHQVVIDHSDASVEVALPSIPGLSLNTFGSRKTFNNGNPLLDRFFSERTGPECLKKALSEDAELAQTMKRVIRRWRYKMKVMDIESQYVKCKMKFGNGRYVPASVVEPLTKDLVAIAEQLQNACAGAIPDH